MEQTIYYTKYAVSLTLLLRAHPQAQQILLYVLWRRGIETKNEDLQWHFHVGDIANQLGKDEKTIRKHLKPLLQFGILKLVGEVGEQYYLFDTEKYGEYLAVDPNTLTAEKLPQSEVTPFHKTGGEESQSLAGVPLSKNGTGLLPLVGRVKTADPKTADLNTAKQSCPVGQDWTTASLGFEGRPSSFNEPVPSISASSSFFFPVVSHSCASSAASGLTGTGEAKEANTHVADAVVVALSTGSSDQIGKVETTKTGSVAAVAPFCAPERINGQGGNSGGMQGENAKCVPPRPVYVFSQAILPLPLPSHISPKISAKRQDAIVNALNDKGYSFVKEGAISSSFAGFKVCAYDSDAEVILLTADDLSYAKKPHIQKLCAHFTQQDWMVILWTADDQSVHVVHRKPILTSGGNLRGKKKPHDSEVSAPAQTIQGSVAGNTNIGVDTNTTGHSGTSADAASGGMAIGFTDAEKQELKRKHGYTEDELKRIESAFIMEQIYGPRKTKPSDESDC